MCNHARGHLPEVPEKTLKHVQHVFEAWQASNASAIAKAGGILVYIGKAVWTKPGDSGKQFGASACACKDCQGL
jgi:hypothetical protein